MDLTKIQVPDFRQIRDLVKGENESCNPALSPLENATNCINSVVALPKPEVQAPVIAAFACLPTILLRQAPILLVCGRSGCGKSDLLQVIAAVNGSQPMAASSSLVSIRNRITDDSRILGLKDYPSPIQCLVFDDAKEGFVEDEDKFTLLRCGYDRGTSSQSISSAIIGQNLDFDIFCPKALSTTGTFVWEAQYVELLRRCLIVEVEKLFDDPRVDALSKPDTFDFKPLYEQLLTHWLDARNCTDYIQILGSLRRSPSLFSSDNWIVIKPLVANLIHFLGMEVMDAKLICSDFLGMQDKRKPPIRQILEDHLLPSQKTYEKLYAKGVNPDPVWVDPAVIKGLMDTASRHGLINNARLSSFKPELLDMGWKIGKGKEDRLGWIYEI